MKTGDTVYVLSGLDVEEARITAEGGDGHWWLQREGRMRARYSDDTIYASLEAAVARSKTMREIKIRRLLREVQKLATNTNVKVRLLKSKRAPKRALNQST